MTTSPSQQAGTDPLAQLEALLQKSKAAKGGGSKDLAAEQAAKYAEAEKLAAEQAAKEAELQAQLDAAEAERQRALVEQQEKMEELANTPQYQARIQQTAEAHQKDEAEKAIHDGHQIEQIKVQKM